MGFFKQTQDDKEFHKNQKFFHPFLHPDFQNTENNNMKFLFLDMKKIWVKVSRMNRIDFSKHATKMWIHKNQLHMITIQQAEINEKNWEKYLQHDS